MILVTPTIWIIEVMQNLLLSSYFNALNRFEYLRAYDYWENPADQQGTFNEFMTAKENIAQVTATFGEVFSEGAAGNFYYTIPVAYTFHMNDLSIAILFWLFHHPYFISSNSGSSTISSSCNI